MYMPILGEIILMVTVKHISIEICVDRAIGNRHLPCIVGRVKPVQFTCVNYLIFDNSPNLFPFICREVGQITVISRKILIISHFHTLLSSITFDSDVA